MYTNNTDGQRERVAWWSLMSYLLLQTVFGALKLSVCPDMTVKTLLLPTFFMWVYVAGLALWHWVTLDLDFAFNNEDLEG